MCCGPRSTPTAWSRAGDLVGDECDERPTCEGRSSSIGLAEAMWRDRDAADGLPARSAREPEKHVSRAAIGMLGIVREGVLRPRRDAPSMIRHCLLVPGAPCTSSGRRAQDRSQSSASCRCRGGGRDVIVRRRSRSTIALGLRGIATGDRGKVQLQRMQDRWAASTAGIPVLARLTEEDMRTRCSSQLETPRSLRALGDRVDLR